MGTGKTAVGKRLAKRLGWAFVDTDVLIEASAKRSIARIFAEHSEAVFRRLERRIIRRVVRGREQVIAAGGGAFVDPESQRALRGVGPIICLTASPKVILERVSRTPGSRPMLAGGPPLLRIQQLLAQRAPAYAKADLTIDVSRLSVEETVELIWEHVGPWISRSWQYLVKHSDELAQRYGGRYIAVLDDRIVGTGTTQLEAYRRVPKPVPASREVGIYYIPSLEKSAVVL